MFGPKSELAHLDELYVTVAQQLCPRLHVSHLFSVELGNYIFMFVMRRFSTTGGVPSLLFERFAFYGNQESFHVRGLGRELVHYFLSSFSYWPDSFESFL
jgi:hypothetical protein